MKFTNEELHSMSFNDAFELEKPSDYEEEDCCIVCGNKLENLKIGFNEKEKLYKFECSNCGAICVKAKNAARSERVLLHGEERKWPEYLLDTLKFPFDAEVIESNDREFFDPEYDGPCLYDTVKVLEVFYSMKYGVEALVRKGRSTYQQILCFLETYDKHNREELENYKRWREKYWLSDYLVALTEALRGDKPEDQDE